MNHDTPWANVCLRGAGSRQPGHDWVAGIHGGHGVHQKAAIQQIRHFILYILHLTHLQSIFKYVSLCDIICGALWLHKLEEVLWEVETLLETNLLEVPAESKFLLEFDFNLLYQSSFEQQIYWVRAIKAVRRSGYQTALMWLRWGAGACRRAGRVQQTQPTIYVLVVVE